MFAYTYVNGKSSYFCGAFMSVNIEDNKYTNMRQLGVLHS